jgi:hypothetical protein
VNSSSDFRLMEPLNLPFCVNHNTTWLLPLTHLVQRRMFLML